MHTATDESNTVQATIKRAYQYYNSLNKLHMHLHTFVHKNCYRYSEAHCILILQFWNWGDHDLDRELESNSTFPSAEEVCSCSSSS